MLHLLKLRVHYCRVTRLLSLLGEVFGSGRDTVGRVLAGRAFHNRTFQHRLLFIIKPLSRYRSFYVRSISFPPCLEPLVRNIGLTQRLEEV